MDSRVDVCAGPDPRLGWGQVCVTGRVVDAASNQPVAGAAISAAWAALRKDRVEDTKQTTSDSTGHYRLCLKHASSALLVAVRGVTRAYLPIVTPSIDSALGDLRLPVEGDTGSATLTGRVVSDAGTPIGDATVTILGSHLMQRAPPTLATVNVVAERLHLAPVYDAIGLTARMKVGHGHFLTAEEIKNRQDNETAELFRGMPGVRVQLDHNNVLHAYADRGASTLIGYGACTAYFVNGVLLGNGRSVYTLDAQSGQIDAPEDEEQIPPPGALIAVEVYQPEEPAPVPEGSVGRCLKILLWTKAMIKGK